MCEAVHGEPRCAVTSKANVSARAALPPVIWSSLSYLLSTQRPLFDWAVLTALCMVFQEKEVLHRKERDRANVAEREVEHLNETIAAKDAQIATLQEKMANSEAKLQQAQLEHEQTKTALQATQTELRQRDAELESLREQLVEQRRTTNTTQQRVVALERLTADFEALAKEAEADEADMEAWRDALEARRSKMLTILEAAERSALGDVPQLSQEGADSQTMAALAEQVLSRALSFL